MRKIGGLLGRSPFGPLREHMLKVSECAARVLPLLEALAAGEFERVGEISAAITKLEGEADEIKNDIRESLSKSLFSAVERGEVMYLLKAQDDIADNALSLALLVDVRKTRVPPELGERLTAMARTVAGCVEEMVEAMGALFGLGGEATRNQQQQGLARTRKVREEEFEVEKMVHELLRALFVMEDRLDPVSVVMLMNITRELARIAGKADNCAMSAERLVLRK